MKIVLQIVIVLAAILFLYNSSEEPFSKFNRYILLMAAAIILMRYMKFAQKK